MGFAEESRYLFACYRRTDLKTRLHVYTRWLLCPFRRIIASLPQDGCHLDVGCGHGLLLALMRRRDSEQILDGIDVSRQKIGQAQRVEAHDISLKVGDVQSLEPDSYSSISVVDVLYLLSTENKLNFLKACHSALRPGGFLVVKEVSRVNWWKTWLIFIQEFFIET